MDVLVQWSDGSENVVACEQLVYKPPLKKQIKVKMKWGRIWWKGRVLYFEDTSAVDHNDSSDQSDSSDDSDDVPLSAISANPANTVDLHDDSSDDVPLSAISANPANTVDLHADSSDDSDDAPLSAISANPANKPTADHDDSSDDTISAIPANKTTAVDHDVSSSDDVPRATVFSNPANSRKLTSEHAYAPASGLLLVPNEEIHHRSVLVAERPAERPEGAAQICSVFDCQEEIFAACTTCLCLLCFEHFISTLPCESHNAYFAQIVNPGVSAYVECSGELAANHEGMVKTDSFLGTHDTDTLIDNSFVTPNNAHDDMNDFNSQSEFSPEPEDFEVEGGLRIEMQITPTKTDLPSSLARNKHVKTKINKGEGYWTEKTNNFIVARKSKYKPTCTSLFCQARQLECSTLSVEDRLAIRDAYFSIENLKMQREWIFRHIRVETPKKSTRKKRFTRFYLPHGSNNLLIPVCKQMFLNTVGISDRQVRTVVKKVGAWNILGGEFRGGRQTKMKDGSLRDEVRKHIGRFPKTESHYCRASTKYQFLSSDLNVNKMHSMYLADKPKLKASKGFYAKELQALKLKFHKPKKDQCGLCESYHSGNDQEQNVLRVMYERHINEKDAVREIKNEKKRQAVSEPNKYQASVFDLQQVIYLPRSNRGALFYKRRLACFNFTIYELNGKSGFCYLHHEGVAKRGSNEIASHLYKYLLTLDDQGKEEISLFSDGCAGQNKNSVLPAMLSYFIGNSSSVNKITLYFFETSHGQSEGDSMHSTVERCLKNTGYLFVPCQLATVVQVARKFPAPYHVTEVQTKDIRDWKDLSKSMHILRVRTTIQGQSINWTKVMQVEVRKNLPNKLLVKFSHLEEEFGTIDLEKGQRLPVLWPLPFPSKAYATPPKLAESKFNDLMSLCSGMTPVISHKDYISFYKNLPHY